MNQKLQQLLDLIQHSLHLSDEEKNSIAKSVKVIDKEIEITNFKLERTEKVKRTTGILLEETIEELEQKNKAVEEQKRVLEIEASLEKIRLQALSMRKPEDLLEICEILYSELSKMGFDELRNTMINIYEEDKTYFLNYDFAPRPGKTLTNIPYGLHPLIDKQIHETKNISDAFIEFSFEGDELINFRELRKNKIGEPDDPKLDGSASLNYYFYSIGNGSIGISTYQAIAPEKLVLLKRFRNVFNLSYQRYTDIVRAEEQSREAQIETALEKVRSRTMAMQSSNELQETAAVLFQEFKKLGVNDMLMVTIGIYNEAERVMDFRVTNWAGGGEQENRSFEVDMDEPTVAKPAIAAWKAGNKSAVFDLSGDALRVWLDYRNKISGIIIKSQDTSGRRVFSLSYFSKGHLSITTPIPLADQTLKTLERFAAVFDGTYTRFLDLQKAEAQAKEALIEAAMERVRSRSMAMHKSDEVKEVAHALYTELQRLDFTYGASSIIIMDQNNGDMEHWVGGFEQEKYPESYYVKYFDHPCYTAQLSAWKEGKKFLSYELKGIEKEQYDEVMFSKTDYQHFPEKEKNWMLNENTVTFSLAYMQHGAIQWGPSQLTFEQSIILQRFAKVFEQTYTRFLDLQKAEAQTREAQIELALERVRARTMAMQHSNQLREIAATTLEQLQSLGFTYGACSIVIMNAVTGDMTWWISGFGNDYPTCYENYYFEHPFYLEQLNNWKEGKKYAVMVCEGEAKKMYDKFIFSETEFVKIPDELQKIMRSFEKVTFSNAYMRHGALSWSTEPLSDDYARILQRFAAVFEQSYTRFLDLQKAEAQAREAEIELALERVRARTMAMQHSNELSETATLLFKQVLDLGINAFVSAFHIWQEDDISTICWASGDAGGMQPPIRIPHTVEPFHKQIYEARQRGDNFFMMETEGNDLAEAYRFLYSLIDGRKVIANIEDAGFPIPKSQATHCAFFLQGYIMFNTYQPVPEAYDIFQRFGKVFEQTYTRFLDLQKAEAQTREAQIEAALEKVRSVAMSMHHSNELLSICESIYVELLKLNITELRNTMINIHNDAEETFLNYDYSAYAGKAVTKYGYHIHPIISQLVMQCRSTQDAFVDIALAGDEFESWRSFRKKSGEKDDKRLNSITHLHYYFYSIGIGSIGISTFESIDNEKLSLLKRFRNVFQLAYQRFTDLLAAEMQAKEAQIESSLERVRSKTMAMHNSDEVGETVAVLFDELVKLGVNTNRCGILICSESKTHAEVWTAKSNPSSNATLITGKLELNMHPLIEGFYRSWKKKKEVFTYTLKGDDMVSYYKAINKSKYYPTKFNLTKLPEQEVHTDFYFADGAIFSFSPTPIDDEAASIFKRFAKVFGQTYRRYLDLQKAESSARESQIEAALERVRGKAMAMHSSNDLSIAANTVFTELKLLGVESFRSGVGLLNKNNRKATAYITTSAHGKDSLDLAGEIEMAGHESYERQYQAWLKNEMYVAVLEGADMDKYYSTFVKNFSLVESKKNDYHEKEFGYYLPFSEGLMYSWSTRAYTEVEINILNRFKTIIDLTFRRYIELQKAEANALEALRSASLDRVRAEIASMRNTADLEKITPLIWKELTVLNIPFVRCGVFIMDEKEEMIHTFLSTPDGKAIASLHLPYTRTPLVNSIEYWRDKKLYQTHWGLDTYAVFTDAIADETTGMNKEHYLSSVPKEGIHLHLLPFLQGMLYVGNTEPLAEDNLSIIQSVADAFSTAYARYEDFIKLEDAKKQIENTLTDLQAAQKQLIQSEKMASLGELTAGIAHEIQNPLNFVNNFSEVSSELISEMVEEVDKGNFDEVKAIADDVKRNLEKINHHGKRAADIVKGMLQHSRSSSGVKEPTDINALADEYLRLAYHGLRAKDKTFNATMKADFDESIGKINIIPQDIGRVVLNLITNAFYVVNEKTKAIPSALAQQSDGMDIKPSAVFEPTVWVSTKKVGDKVLISVKDNGNGIPPKILDKIFQPFFTTKPTGQGTGLGLSLSYDIVKAHGGELKVETFEGKGSVFIIHLPVYY